MTGINSISAIRNDNKLHPFFSLDDIRGVERMFFLQNIYFLFLFVLLKIKLFFVKTFCGESAEIKAFTFGSSNSFIKNSYIDAFLLKSMQLVKKQQKIFMSR